ncbi:unnamed protein product [Prunus armeniaca]|uniref:Uncharacterized protein n=1 Tax=Prunus armeniaca TaxID=36596 RepID=A0A6J5V996_PRUAR|nr:unnamed protein product [Prunus armeniaca]
MKMPKIKKRWKIMWRRESCGLKELAHILGRCFWAISILLRFHGFTEILLNGHHKTIASFGTMHHDPVEKMDAGTNMKRVDEVEEEEYSLRVTQNSGFRITDQPLMFFIKMSSFAFIFFDGNRKKA